MSGPPLIRLIVSIDAEEDNWVPARSGITTSNIAQLAALERRFEALGVRATYFTNYQVALQPSSAAVIRAIHDSRRAEIGAHLHPWNTPPLLDQSETMLLNLPPETQARKIDTVTQQLAGLLDVVPRAFRAGRFGLGSTTVQALIKVGYAIDSSVTPFFSWEDDRGPSYVGAPVHMYRLGGTGDVRRPDARGALVEVPLSCGYNRWHPRSWPSLAAGLNSANARRLYLPSMAARLRVARRIIMSPEPHGVGDLIALARALLNGGLPFLHVFWHSSSMSPGLTPFCRTAADVERMLTRFERLLDFVARHASLRFVTMSEAVTELGVGDATREPPPRAARPDLAVSVVANPVLSEPVALVAEPGAGMLEPVTMASEELAAEASPSGRMGRHTAIYFAGILLGRAVAFVMLPFYTRYFTPADYGIMQLLDMALDIISIIAGTRIASGIHRYYFKAQTAPERNAVLSTAFVLLTISFFAFGAFTFLLAEPLTTLILGTGEHANLMRISGATFALQSFIIVPFSILQLWKRSILVTVLGIIKLLTQLSLNILFLAGLGLGLRSVFLSTLIANLLLGGILIFLVVRKIGVGFSGGAAGSLMRYGVPLMVTQFATFFVTYGDRYFLRVSGDTTQVGLYSLAYQFGFLVAAIGYVPFALIWEPTRFQIANQPDRDALYARAFIFMNVLQLIVTVGTALYVRDVIAIMADPAYHSAYAIVPVIVAAYLLQSWAYFHEVGILVRERTGWVTFANWVAAGVAFAGYALLIPRWLGWGAAITTLIAFLVRWIIIYVVAQRLLPVRYEWPPVIRLVVVSTAFVMAGLFLPHPNVPVSLVFRSLLMLAYLWITWHLGVIGPDEKARMLSVVRSPRTALGSLLT